MPDSRPHFGHLDWRGAYYILILYITCTRNKKRKKKKKTSVRHRTMIDWRVSVPEDSLKKLESKKETKSPPDTDPGSGEANIRIFKGDYRMDHAGDF